MTTLVQIENLTKHFIEGNNTRAILDDASATFDEGEFIAIRGRSGSGKSTLLNLIGAIDSPTRGDITINGVAVTRLNAGGRTVFRRDNIGFVFQFFNLIPTLNVLENVSLPAELAGQNGKELTSRAMTLLDHVCLSDRAKVFPDKLSGGEQQRVAIARALIQNPRLVLADEPTGNLDDATGNAVIKLLDEMTRQAGKTLIMVTHSYRIAALADHVLTIENGKIIPMKEMIKEKVDAAD
ncbi:MAG: ABC transporter ATP-binding protein [Chloroflexota bacterium]